MIKLKRKLLPFVYKLATIYWHLFKPRSLGVRVIIEKDNKVLLVKHSYQNYYFFPGGAVNKFEDIEKAARREIKEEIGLKVGFLTLQGVYRSNVDGKDDTLVVLSSNDTDGEIQIDEIEIIDANWYQIDNLPSNIHPNNKKALEKYMKKEIYFS